MIQKPWPKGIIQKKDTHTLDFDVTVLIDAYRLHTIKKHGIGDTVLYLGVYIS